MARAFVTGIGGFAGSHLAEHLLARGDEVAGLARPGDATPNLRHLEGKVSLREGDVTDLAGLTAILSDARPERVFHLAGLASPRLSFADPIAFHRVNALGTAALLEAVGRAGLAEARVLVVSSAECYGRAGAGPIAEDAPLRPVSPYGASKAAAEMMAVAAFEGRRQFVVRTRSFNHTGPRQEAEFSASAFARQIALAEAGRGVAEIHVGRLDAVRDFSHVGDVARSYAALLEHGAAGEVYNVGSGRGMQIGEVLAYLVSLARVPVVVVDDPARHRPIEIPSMVADTRKFLVTTGLRHERNAQVALSDLLDHWRSHLE